jgi:pyruvate dehydrogenase E1 component beta subunit
MLRGWIEIRELSYAEALRAALREEMSRDESVFLMGEDIEWCYGFGVSRDLVQEFGPERIRDTPISENAIVGCGLGAAITGMRPVVEIWFGDLLALCMDQIVNEAAKMRYTSGEQVIVPLVIRTPGGVFGAVRGGPVHTQSLESWFIHVPGLKVVMPSTPYDAKGLLKTSIRDDNLVMFFEHKMLYHIKGQIPDEEYLIPLGKAAIRKQGDDVTIVATSLMMHRAYNVAQELTKEGISVELIDPRTLVPLDRKTIVDSVKKTGKLIIVEEGVKTGGVGAEISALVSEEAFDYLDAPIQRVAAFDAPIPYSPSLESHVIPSENLIIEATRKSVS